MVLEKGGPSSAEPSRRRRPTVPTRGQRHQRRLPIRGTQAAIPVAGVVAGRRRQSWSARQQVSVRRLQRISKGRTLPSEQLN